MMTAATPVIALSGHSADADIERALAAGFDAYLTKPFGIARLLATIDGFLTRQQ